jgi:CBS-domain-containing membrane protein
MSLPETTSTHTTTTATPGRGARDLELREALRVSREAIVAIQDELDALLRSVQARNAARGAGNAGTAPAPRVDAIERLARSTRRADAAVRGLSTSSS